MTDKLKPCPFCGEKAHLDRHDIFCGCGVLMVIPMLMRGFKGDKMLLEQKEVVKITLELFDLINRQQAEIETMQALIDHLEAENYVLMEDKEKLRVEIKWLEEECGNQSVLWSKYFESIFETAKETIKAEAYKEFAERLKKKIRWCFSEIFVRDEIDNLLIEMESENNVDYTDYELAEIADALNLLKEMESENNG